MGIQLADEPAAADAAGPRRVTASAGPRPAAASLVVGRRADGGRRRASGRSVANQSIFADELSTYWISATHALGGVLSLMYGTAAIQHAEITPPLYFLAVVADHAGRHMPGAVLRLPSLIAGAVTIPLVYAARPAPLGRRAALVAAALTALSPFMIYYSGEARAYALMMLLLVASTLSMLLALDTGRARWWVLYAACSCAAFYTHYTAAFILATQFVWLVWAHPRGSARRS